MDGSISARLEELRVAIRAESISYGEIAELQGLAEHIEAGDVELLEWAGVPEFPTVQWLAEQASSWFVNATRDGGTPFVKTRDDRPEWLTALIYDAHGDMLPDDWKYATIRDALDFIAECDDPDDGYGEFADSAVDVYNHDRIAWLGSHGSRQGYCDEAIEELGSPDEDSIMTRIGLGQYVEASEVYGSVLSSLEARLAEMQV